MPPRSKALALPPMAEESTAKLLPALSAQLNKAQKSNSDLKHATTVCGRLQHHCGASVVVEESGVPGGAAAPHTRVATRSAIS